jgi:hypothetical protein
MISCFPDEMLLVQEWIESLSVGKYCCCHHDKVSSGMEDLRSISSARQAALN